MEPEIYFLPAFEDNYIWCLRQGRAVTVVDPGDPEPVLEHLSRHDRYLSAILVTHHHGDHTGGVTALTERYPVPVFAPAAEGVAGTTEPVSGGEHIVLPDLGVEFEVINVAGHTRGHVAYYRRGSLFCGDTLFGCGCGKLFEGTASQLHRALTTIAALPADTQIYCGHEYTASGIRFAYAVEPSNPALPQRATEVARRRNLGQATVPFSLADELATNPFLRCREPAVVTAATQWARHGAVSDTEVFAILRQWRDNF